MPQAAGLGAGLERSLCVDFDAPSHERPRDSGVGDIVYVLRAGGAWLRVFALAFGLFGVIGARGFLGFAEDIRESKKNLRLRGEAAEGFRVRPACCDACWVFPLISRSVAGSCATESNHRGFVLTHGLLCRGVWSELCPTARICFSRRVCTRSHPIQIC